MLESKFQSELKRNIEQRFPSAIVLKNDPTSRQGFPDLTILFKDKYAVLEVKKNATARTHVNQTYYVDYIKRIGGFSEKIYPENKELILDEMEDYFCGNNKK